MEERAKKKKQSKSLSAIDDGRTAFLTSIVNSSDDAIIGKTINGVITSWNGAAGGGAVKNIPGKT